TCRAACVAALFAMTGLVHAAPPTSAEIDRALNSKDKAQLQTMFARIKQDAGLVDPAYLMLMAPNMQQLGQPEDAVFWFLAGQLRMRYVLAVSPDETRSQVFASLLAGLGMMIYAPFENDMGRLAPIVDRVLAWDKATPVDFSWLTGQSVLPRSQWEGKFAPIRQGMVKLKAEFLAVPKDECERIAKSMA